MLQPEKARQQGPASRPAGPKRAPGAAPADAASPAPTAATRPIEEVAPAYVARAHALARALGHRPLLAVTRPGTRCELQPLNNALMDAFRVSGEGEAFTLLFELNVRPFALVAARIMRLTGCRADPHDILQEAFLAIYRYPSRFRAEKPHAFRNWSYSILRNTVYRHAQSDAREGIPAEMLADVLEDTSAAPPDAVTEEAESDDRCKRVYALLLCLYAYAYEHELKPRDRLALELVEVQKLGYREATELLGIRLENFKMVVCRARKKILQTIVRALGTQLP